MDAQIMDTPLMDAQINERLNTLRSVHTDFVAIANQLKPAVRNKNGVCGEWSPKDVVAHLVGWDASLKQLIVDIENFEPPYDVHGFNQASVAARTERSWGAVLDELTTNFSELEQALATLHGEMRIYERVYSWMAGRVEDYRLHTGQLAEWVA